MRSNITPSPALRFSPTAWAQLLFLRDYGNTEVGGFGIAPADDLLFVEDLQLIRQECSWAHVAFDDEAVADYFDQQVVAGRHPDQFARIWIHSLRGDYPQPSLTDEETFDRVFGRADWAVMFILACSGNSYARLRYNTGPSAEVELPVEIDFTQPFVGSSMQDWEAEYLGNVSAERLSNGKGGCTDSWSRLDEHNDYSDEDPDR